jgi:hypothetical protein
MKKLTAVSLIMAGMVLVGGFLTLTQAQGPGIDAKPTFLSPTPGLYVNGWPSFTVSYPKDWVEGPEQLYRAATEDGLPALVIRVFASPADISGSAGILVGFLGQRGGNDVTVLYDKPSWLKDGIPVREAEMAWILPGVPKLNTFMLATKKDDIWIMLSLTEGARMKAMTGEDLKSVAYSLKVPQGKQEPVKVPPDVRAFLDKFCRDLDSGDIGKIMTNYSDRYLHCGTDKAGEEWFYRSPSSPIRLGVTSRKATVTIFEREGDKAYLAGFQGGQFKSGANAPAWPIAHNQLINEHGQWKWFGNQR